jgi:hypothetical protein
MYSTAFKKETPGEGFDKKDQRPYLAEINHTLIISM